MGALRLCAAAVVGAGALVCGAAQPVPAISPLLPPSWRLIEAAAGGGTVWQGPIVDRELPQTRRVTLVYLPPDARPDAAYPLVVLLQGFPGSPYSYVHGIQLAQIADRLLSARRIAPFVAVIPPAGVTGWYDGEWAGPWERFLVRDVLPWTERLPVSRRREERTIAGLSAGGYGAADIGLRHPRLFGTIESWSGYFGAPRDGPLRGATTASLQAHDPALLAAGEAPLLRRLGTRFLLESATTHDRAGARQARRFARELRRLRLPVALVLGPGGHDGAFWRAHLPAALEFALSAQAAPRSRTPTSSS